MSARPRLVDAHCHLDLFSDFEEEAARRQASATWTLAVTTIPQAWERNREIAARHSMVEAALGVHPELVAQYPRAVHIWTALAQEARFVGEVGLDGRPKNRRSFPTQVAVFSKILDTCSEQGGKVLTVHSAGAQREVLSLLEERLDMTGSQAVLHWFTGTGPLFARALELGCYFSVNLAMLKDKRIERQIRKLPRERLLTESDAPFLPSTGRGGRACADETIESLALALEVPREDAMRLVGENLEKLLSTQKVTSPPPNHRGGRGQGS